MRYSVKIKDGFAEFEFGRVPLGEIILDVEEYGSITAKVALSYFLHTANQRQNGSCRPNTCEICKIEKEKHG